MADKSHMVIERRSPVTGVHDFESASTAVLEYLQDRLGLDLWMVTRTEGDDFLVLDVRDSAYGITRGSVFRWSDSFCSRMVAGRGPRIAPRAKDVPAYVEAPIGWQVKIGAYVGVPLICGDGELFGTLCAIDPTAQAESLNNELRLVELLAGILSGILTVELDSMRATRRAERLLSSDAVDPLTGIRNRRSWNQLLLAEDSRCCRYGLTSCVVSIAVASGDPELFREAALILQASIGATDELARIEGGEFAVLGVERGVEPSMRLFERLRRALAKASIPAAIGVARRPWVQGGLLEALREADRLRRLDQASRAYCETVGG